MSGVFIFGHAMKTCETKLQNAVEVAIEQAKRRLVRTRSTLGMEWEFSFQRSKTLPALTRAIESCTYKILSAALVEVLCVRGA